MLVSLYRKACANDLPVSNLLSNTLRVTVSQGIYELCGLTDDLGLWQSWCWSIRDRGR